MKIQFYTLAFIAVVIALFNTSCVVRTGSNVTVEEIYKMPPFKATVETIEIDHSFIFGDSVCIWLRKADGGNRLVLQWGVANKLVVDFANGLHKGQSYTFPQVIVDYNNSLLTNAVAK